MISEAFDVLAAADDVGIATFANFGAVGAIAALGIVFAKGAYQDVKDQRDAAVKEVARLNQLILDTQLAALQETSTALVRSTDVLRDVVTEERGHRDWKD